MYHCTKKKGPVAIEYNNNFKVGQENPDRNVEREGSNPKLRLNLVDSAEFFGIATPFLNVVRVKYIF